MSRHAAGDFAGAMALIENEMRSIKSLNQSGRIGTIRVFILASLLLIFGGQLVAQKVIVLTNADIAKVVTGIHHYSVKDETFKLTLRHRLSGIGPMQVSLQKEQQFGNSPFTLKSTLPAELSPDGSLDLEFGVSYSRSLQQANTISLLAVPVGDPDPKTRGIAINIKLSADEVLMFFNDRAKQYTKTLPTFEFVGPTEKLIEVTWNGGTSRNCIYKIETSGRDGFSLVPNAAGAAPLQNGAEIKLNTGGNSFFIRYDGAARKGTVDLARITFTEPGGQSIKTEMVGTYQGGANQFAAAKDLLSKGKLIGDYVPPVVVEPKVVAKEPIKAKDPVKVTEPKVTGGSDSVPNPVVVRSPNEGSTPKNIGEPIPQPSRAAVMPIDTEEYEDGLNEEQAKARLLKYYLRHKDENIVKVGQARFEKVDGIFEAFVPIGIDSILKEDPNFNITPIWVKAVLGSDTVTLPGTNYSYRADSARLTIKLSEEAVEKMAKEDSFQIRVGFMPDYLAGNTPVADKSLVFTGNTYAKMYSNSYLAIILWTLLGLAVFLFFFIGFVVARRPVSSFRYLRESRYQRERHKANSERQRVDVETVHIDLARQDTDLIQLAFVDRGEGLDGRKGDTIEKVRSIHATVPVPRRGALVRFFSWLYAPFGRKREPKFKSVYYSLRIEMIKGAVPQHLRLKDESGMIMLGTTLTGNVLATDLQDFKFTQRPFGYSVYLDPAEFLDYTGAMRTVSIPFRVIEEPFEGYVMTREFNLNLEIAQRF